jgi:hypothetical protein
MDDVILARVLHIIGAVLWIGGVAFVTSIVLPIAGRRMPADDRLQLFDAIECRFAGQARWTTLLPGLSGLYMVHRLDLWHRFLDAEFWWSTPWRRCGCCSASCSSCWSRCSLATGSGDARESRRSGPSD